jgi:polysaccharide biosynthesis transport protein
MNGPTFAPATTAPTNPASPAMPRPAKPRAAERQRLEGGNPGLMVFTYLRLHWMMILFCGLLIGSGLAYAAYSLMPAKYESVALLLVSSSPPSIASQNDMTRGRTEFSTYIKTNAQLIKQEFVLNSALNDTKYRISDLSTLKEQKDPIRYLDEKLQVNYSEGSEVVKISLEGDRPEEIRKIVDAVKDAFFREVVQKELTQKAVLKQKVEEARTTLETQMRGKPGFLPEVKVAASQPVAPRQMPSAMPMVGGNTSAVAPGNDPIQQATAIVPAPPGAITSAISGLDSDVVRKARFNSLMERYTKYDVYLVQDFPRLIKQGQGNIEVIKKQLEKFQNQAPPPELLAAVERDPEVMQKKAEAKRLQEDYKYLLNVANNPNSERIERMKAKADSVEAEAQKLIQDKAKLLDAGSRRGEGDRLTRQLENAERTVRQLEEEERVTRKMLEDVKKELAEMPPEIRKEEAKKPLVDPVATDLLMHDDMYRRLTSQLIGLDLELKSPPRVQPLQAASSPSQKDTKKQIIATVGAGLMGFVLMAVGVIALESRARRISSLSELTGNVTTPVVGVLPWSPDSEGDQDPLKRADLVEAVDKLRGQVVQSYLNRGLGIFTITSPLGDEGKAYTAFHLAKSLTESGTRTLLVDFDLREPSLHKLAGMENSEGLCELLRGDLTPNEAQIVLPCGMSFVPAGKWSEEARRAAVSGMIDTLLKHWRKEFDCIILHGHALLTVAESVEVARRSEVVLLCTLYRETRLPLLKRATDRLATMDVQHSAIVYLGASSQEAIC